MESNGFSSIFDHLSWRPATDLSRFGRNNAAFRRVRDVTVSWASSLGSWILPTQSFVIFVASWNLKDALKMDFLLRSISITDNDFHVVHLDDQGRLRQRGFPHSSPPGTVGSVVPDQHVITFHDLLADPPSIREVGSLHGLVSLQLQDLSPDLAVGPEDLLHHVLDGLGLADRRPMEFALQGCLHRPSSIDIPRRVPMGTGRVVDHVLDAREQLRNFIGVALHDVHDKDPEQLLDFLVLTFDKALLHRSPGGPELLSNAENGRILFHQVVLELRPLIASDYARNGPRPEHTASECPPSFRR